MKRDTLRLSQHQVIETSRDINGRYFIAYSGGASVYIRETKELRKFLKLPKSIPMRESLESWLASLEDMDQKRKGAVPLTSEDPVQPTSSNLSQELLATGFGPECHDDEDPTANTRTII